MKKIHTNRGNAVVGILIFGLIVWGAVSLFSSDSNDNSSDSYKSSSTYNSNYNEKEDYEDDGYSWAEYNDISSFDECQDQFGTSYEEDECNRYVKENHTGYNTFNGYDCTEDCSGHEAGYNWAEENDISDEYDCDGNSNSFNEGCTSYVEDNY
jgi:hypothetical protein